MSNLVNVTHPYSYAPLFDKGKPIAGGKIYIGEVDLDPEIPANQKTIYFAQEDGSTITGSQPVILSAGGVPTYNGSPVAVRIGSDYSIKILTSADVQVYYSPSGNISTGDASNISYTEGSTETTVSDALDARIPHKATVATLIASTEEFSVGSYVGVSEGGFRYKVVASGGDIQNASGVELQALPNADGWLSIEQLGAVYDGDSTQTDQYAKVQALIDAGVKRISLGRSGVLYLADTITTPDNDPDEEIVITSHGATVQVGGNTRIFDIGQNTKIKEITFTGSGESSGDTSENIVYISGNGLDEVLDCKFLDCGGTAVIARQYYTVHEGSKLLGNTFKRCRVGIDLQERGEYCTVSQNTLVANGTAVLVAGGNNRVVDNTITDNDVGLWVTTGANDAHGLIGQNTINHNTINIQVDAINVDEMAFDGNLLYVGKIVLNGCSGVVFNGGVIDATCSIEQIGCENCWIIGARMSGAAGVSTTPNMTNPSELVIVDPIFDQGVSITSSVSMGTSYCKARRTGSTTLASGSSTTLPFNSDDTNAIPANTSYTVRDFFNVSTNKFQAKSQFLFRGFTVNFHALITVSHPSLSIGQEDVAAEIVDADDTTNVLGVFTVGRETTISGSKPARVLSFSGSLERKDFLIKLYNDGSNTLTIEADVAAAPCFAELIGV